MKKSETENDYLEEVICCYTMGLFKINQNRRMNFRSWRFVDFGVDKVFNHKSEKYFF